MLLKFNDYIGAVVQTITVNSPSVIGRACFVIVVKRTEQSFHLVHDTALGGIEG